MDIVYFIILVYSIMAVEDAAEKSAEELQAVREMLERMERGQAPPPNRTGSNKTGTI